MMRMRMLLKVSIICLLAFIQNPSPINSEVVNNISGPRRMVAEGRTITVHCNLNEARPTVLWYKDMQELRPIAGKVRMLNDISYKSILLVSNANEDDAGVYSCGTAGESVKSVTVYIGQGGLVLNVNGRQHIWPGCPLELECIVVGDPLQVQWYKDGIIRGRRRRSVDYEYSLLRLDNPTSEDSGLYECKMPSNSTGSRHVEIRDEEGEAIILQGEEYVGLGCPIELTCEVEANPFLVTWYKDDVPLDPDLFSGFCRPSTPLSVLHIEKASSSDGGMYECRTAAGNTGSIHVDVFDEEVEIFGATEVEKGDRLELSCGTMGQAECVSIWWKGGRMLNPEDDDPSLNIETTQHTASTARTTLTIERTTARDAGWYTCGHPDGNSHAFDVHIEDVDTVVRISGTQYVVAGEPITLLCEVTGSSPSSVTWYKDRTRLVTGVTHFIRHDALMSFFEKDSTAEDDGTYYCRTPDGDTASITVHVFE